MSVPQPIFAEKRQPVWFCEVSLSGLPIEPNGRFGQAKTPRTTFPSSSNANAIAYWSPRRNLMHNYTKEIHPAVKNMFDQCEINPQYNIQSPLKFYAIHNKVKFLWIWYICMANINLTIIAKKLVANCDFSFMPPRYDGKLYHLVEWENNYTQTIRIKFYVTVIRNSIRDDLFINQIFLDLKLWSQ